MAIGMTYEQYWYDDPLMVRAFYKAEKLKQKRKDEDAWLHGLYVLRALDASVGNMFRKEGTQPARYPEKPLTVEQDDTERAKKTEQQEEAEATWALAYMTNMVMAGKNWKK